MKKTRKLLSVLLVVSFILSTFCVSAFASNDDAPSGTGYSVTLYHTDSHSDVAVDAFVDISGDFTLPDGPVRAGFAFSGWLENGLTFQPGDVIEVTQDRDFYAQWTPAYPFADIDAEADYFGDVMYVYEHGIMTGTSATTFSPDSMIDRATIWTVLARLDDIAVDGGSPWYAKAQAWAVQENISDGSTPERVISRQELAAMLYRQAGSPAVDGRLEGYIDIGQVADWAQDAMCWALQNGIIVGDVNNGVLTPGGEVPRSELASALTRFCEYRA
jgi:uncharacterized repeat protein (TIGR02543 family)